MKQECAIQELILYDAKISRLGFLYFIQIFILTPTIGYIIAALTMKLCKFFYNDYLSEMVGILDNVWYVRIKRNGLMHHYIMFHWNGLICNRFWSTVCLLFSQIVLLSVITAAIIIGVDALQLSGALMIFTIGLIVQFNQTTFSPKV